jgi:hypothetical protein
MGHQARLQCNGSAAPEIKNARRYIPQARTAALAIRLRLPQSFREKYQQLVGNLSIKKALESAL